MPLATPAVLDLAEQDAEAYVRSVRDRMGAEGLVARWSVGRGKPLTVLIHTAGECGADLVAMATHARGAMAGFWSGSLTPKLMHRLDRPMLLVRAEGDEPTR
jgi:nucleotide-binding universal stress UspA family protein